MVTMTTKKTRPMPPLLSMPKRRENRGFLYGCQYFLSPQWDIAYLLSSWHKNVSWVSASNSPSPDELNLNKHYNSPHSTISIFNFGVWPETGTFSIFRTWGEKFLVSQQTALWVNDTIVGKNITYCQHAGRIQYFAEHTMFAIQKVRLAGRDEKLATYMTHTHEETTFL
jgi:hypothetical protein